MLYGKMGWGRSLTYQHVNVRRFSKLLTPETCRGVSKWGYLHSVKSLSEKSLI